MRRVVVTGTGVIAPGGANSSAFFSTLVAGRSSIGRLKPDAVPLKTPLAAAVDFDPEAHFAPNIAANLDRFSQLALIAARQAAASADLRFDAELSEKTGVFWGSVMGGNGTLEHGYFELLTRGKTRLRPLTVPMSMTNAAASQIGIEFGVHGPVVNCSTACSSSAFAIGDAFRAIRGGEIDAAIAGGSECMLTYGTITAWEALRTLATEDPADASASCRPFSRDRNGLVLGEGAGALILEAEEHARERNADILAEVVGYGRSNDGSHLTKPSCEGQVRAMRQALREATLAPDMIGYLNAHGTATAVGDVAETNAIKQVFGTHAPRLPISSTKSMHGHLMGAAGAVEFIVALLAMRSGIIPPTAHLRVPDPECDLDYVPNAARHGASIDAVMSNSFAFGGSNVVLIARRYR